MAWSVVEAVVEGLGPTGGAVDELVDHDQVAGTDRPGAASRRRTGRTGRPRRAGAWRRRWRGSSPGGAGARWAVPCRARKATRRPSTVADGDGRRGLAPSAVVDLDGLGVVEQVGEAGPAEHTDIGARGLVSLGHGVSPSSRGWCRSPGAHGRDGLGRARGAGRSCRPPPGACPGRVPVTLLRPVRRRYGTGRSSIRQPRAGGRQDHLERPARPPVPEAEVEQVAPGGPRASGRGR